MSNKINPYLEKAKDIIGKMASENRFSVDILASELQQVAEEVREEAYDEGVHDAFCGGERCEPCKFKGDK